MLATALGLAAGALPRLGPYNVKLQGLVEIGGMHSSVGPDSQLAMVAFPTGAAAAANYSQDKCFTKCIVDSDCTSPGCEMCQSEISICVPYTSAGEDGGPHTHDADWIRERAGTFPLISFLHGIGGGGFGNQAEYSDVITGLASWGFVVVAMDGCSTPLCAVGPFARDQRQVVAQFAEGKVDKAKYPFVALANATNAGISGHSYGGMATVISARDPGPHIRAAWALHPCPCHEAYTDCPATFEISLPIFFTTGTLDTICPSPFVLDDYNKASGSPRKGYADMSGIMHTECMNAPLGRGNSDRWAAYMGAFFRCHLLADQSGCDAMYGSGGDALCSAYDFKRCVHE
jgi:dienelactone hydrolase